MAVQFASVLRTTTSEAIEAQPYDPFLTRLASISTLTPDQVRVVNLMRSPPRRLRPRSQLGCPGNATTAAYVVREGWAFAYTLLANGQRQVLGFLLPGDICCFGSLARAGVDVSIETITDTVIAEISKASVRGASRQWPEVYELFLRLQSEMLSALVGHLIDLGRRDSHARVAGLLLKLERRLLPIGEAGPDGYACPISQYLIADALGLTAIHVNRVLRALREEGVVTLRKNRVAIHNRARLMEIAGYDDGDADDTANIVLMNQGRGQSRAPGHGRPRIAI